MSEARRYQQLRAHLAYLKLNDAAEALPRVLDAARAERLSLTAALERLLESEVEATEARKLASRLRFSCLPEPWTIGDFDFAAQPGVDEKLIRDLATLRFLDDASNVLFVGPPGVGKTMLSVGLARAGVEAGDRKSTRLNSRSRPPSFPTRRSSDLSRLRFSCLPEPWTIGDFDFAAQPGVDEKLIRDLATLRFLDDASNVLFVGPPGVGKTMLSVGLARAGVEA